MAMATSSCLSLATTAHVHLGAMPPSAEQISSLSPWHKPATSRSYIPNACSIEISYSPSTSLTPFLTMNTKKVFRLSAKTQEGTPVASEEEVAGGQGFSEAESAQGEEKEKTQVNEPNPAPGTKVYVGNLPFTCDSAELARIVQEHGSAEMIEVIYNKKTGRSRGFAFVTMSTIEDANAVIENLNGSFYRGRTLKANLTIFNGSQIANRDRTNNSFINREHSVFVGNLSRDVNAEILGEAFSECGNIKRAKVMYDENGRARGYGFVYFSSESGVEAAVALLNGKELEGRVIRVERRSNL